jgi:long-chain acyl-CoA synthetase
VNVPLSVKLSEPSDVAFRIRHSGARFVIVSKNQAKKVFPVIDELSCIERVILLDPDETTKHETVIHYNDIISRGIDYLKLNYQEFNDRWKSVTGDDCANICYTSGTTADPKGIILSHRNYTANIEQSLTLFSVPRTWTTLLILPWDHAFTHTCGIYTLMSCGASLASVQTGDTGIETLKNIPVNING